MRSARFAWVIILLCVPMLGCSSSSTDTAEEPTAEDFHADPALLGTWTIVSSELDGGPNAVAIGNRFTFDGYQVELWMAQLGNLRVEYELDVEPTPKHINVTLGKSPNQKLFRGIYEIDGEKMKLCLRERERPTEFGTTAGTGARYHQMERAVDQDRIQ